jgi:lysozyme family protein
VSDDAIIADLLRREGGYVDRAADRGGPTNMGITIPTLAKWRGAVVTKTDIINLTRAEAGDIYRVQYVSPWAFIWRSSLRELLIDWGVTSHQRNPIKALQSFVNESGIYLKVDGVLGSQTREAWKALEATLPDRTDLACRVIAKERVKFYVRLALDDEADAFMAAHPTTQLHNLPGWVNRGLEFL